MTLSRILKSIRNVFLCFYFLSRTRKKNKTRFGVSV
ncbi:unnamed protein product [Arabidopsis halleri]